MFSYLSYLESQSNTEVTQSRRGTKVAKGQYDLHSKRYGVGEAKATENKEQAHELEQCLPQSSPKAHVTLFSALTFLRMP